MRVDARAAVPSGRITQMHSRVPDPTPPGFAADNVSGVGVASSIAANDPSPALSSVPAQVEFGSPAFRFMGSATFCTYLSIGLALVNKICDFYSMNTIMYLLSFLISI